MEQVWQRLDQGLRSAMPAVVTLAMTLLSVVVWPLPYLGPVMPPLALIALYYWSTHRPDLFPPGLAFLIGLLNDTIHNLPMGISAFLFVVAHQIILQKRRYFAGHSFIMLWSGFAVTAAAMMIAQWVLVAVFSSHAAPLTAVVIQTLLAIILFPLPCWILIRLQRTMLSVG